MALSTYATRRFPRLFCSVVSLIAGGAACASGTIVDEPFELGDGGAGAAVAPIAPGLGIGDAAIRGIASDASLGAARAGSRSESGDAALAHAGAADATAPHASSPAQQPASTSTTPPVSTTPPASTPTGSTTGGTTSPGKLDASTPPDAAGTPAKPATPGGTGDAAPAAPAATQCKSDDDCAEVFCFPLGVAGCCRLDGNCGCTWSDAYCL